MGEQKIFKVCLTGGPCSGKTTSLAEIVQYFSHEFMIYTLPEVATMTFSSGVSIIPSEFTEDNHKEFTKSICQMQIDIEKYFESIAKTQKKKVIIIVDRGVMDNFAFTSAENKSKILEESGWTMNFICNERYDMVIHLVTAANGAEEFYTLEGNSARSESKEQAKEQDNKLMKEWMGHPNFIVIDNREIGFNKKMERVLNKVNHLVGGKLAPTSTHKYLLEDEFTIAQLPKGLDYEEYWEETSMLINNKPDTYCYTIKRVYKESIFPVYMFTTRVLNPCLEKCIQTTKIISERLYFDFQAQKDPNFQTAKKKVYSFFLADSSIINLYSIEVLKLNDSNVNILRVSRDTEKVDKDIIPHFLSVKEDISENPDYTTRNLARIS